MQINKIKGEERGVSHCIVTRTCYLCRSSLGASPLWRSSAGFPNEELGRGIVLPCTVDSRGWKLSNLFISRSLYMTYYC